MQQVNACSVILSDIDKMAPEIEDEFSNRAHGWGIMRTQIDLGKIDPRGVSVKESTSTPPEYSVVVSATNQAVGSPPEKDVTPAGEPTLAPPAPTPFEGIFGHVRSISTTSIVIISGRTRHLISFLLDQNLLVRELGSGSGFGYGRTLADISPGDFVMIDRNAEVKKGKVVFLQEVITYTKTKKPDPNFVFDLELASLIKDKTFAERVAKAYIHALALCYKPPAPSLF